MSEKGPEYSREAYDAVEGEAGQAEEKRTGLKEMAWDEALELNKQYDELWAQKEQNEQAIADFRREKLGMGEEREEEKKGPTMEEQAEIYAEMFDIDVAQILERAQSLQAEMSEDERKELTMLIYAPKNFSTVKAWDMVAESRVYSGWPDPHWMAEGIKTKGETQKAVVAFARFSQEPDEDSLGEQARSAEDWETIGQKFMSPKLRMIAEDLYDQVEGKDLDQKNVTMSPGSRTENGKVPTLSRDRDGRLRLGGFSVGDRHPILGVRRIVSKEF